MSQPIPDAGANHMPSEAEIAELCELLRQGWSERKHRIRAGLTAGRVETPLASNQHRRRNSTIGRD